MGADRPKLRNLSEIYSYLRRNETPIYVITPTPFSLLGLDQWVGSLEFVNYFDIFEGQHPRCFVPGHRAARPSSSRWRTWRTTSSAIPSSAPRSRDRPRGLRRCS